MSRTDTDGRVSFPLHIHLSTVFLVILLVAGAILALQSYNGMRTVVESTTEESLTRISELSASRVEELLGPAETLVEVISRSPIVSDGRFLNRPSVWPQLAEALRSSRDLTAIYAGTSDGAFLLMRRIDASNTERFEAPDGANYLLQQITADRTSLRRGDFIFLDADLQVIERRAMPDYTSYDPRARPWYATAAEDPGTLVATQPYAFFTTGEVGKTVARSSPDGWVTVGADVSLAQLTDTMQDNQLTPNTVSMLVSSDGTVIAHSSPDAISVRDAAGKAQTVPVSQTLPVNAHAAYLSYRVGGPPRASVLDGDQELTLVFDTFQSRTGDAQTLILSIPNSELLAKPNEEAIKQIGWFLLILLATVVPIVFASHALSSTLQHVKRAAEAVRRFEFDTTPLPKSRVSEVQELNDSIDSMRSTISRFLDISASVAAEEDFDRLLQKLLDGIIATTETEAGVLYLTDAEGVTLTPTAARLDQERDLIYAIPNIAITDADTIVIRSIADEHAEGAPVTDGELRLMGLQNIEGAMDAAPQNLLAVPLFNRQKELVGVILLLDTEEMKQSLVRFAEAMSGSAAVSIEARQLIQAQRELFQSFIKMIAGAIDAKSPYTGGHCERVPELTRMIAEAAHEQTEGPFADFRLDADDRHAIHVASWLHDCGKVTTPEFVVDKATKLETIYDRIHEIRMRVEVIKRETEIAFLQDCLTNGTDPSNRAALDETLAALDADFDFLATCNVGGEFMTDEAIERLENLAALEWTRTLDDRIGISHDEKQRRDRTPAPTLPVQERLLADGPEHLFDRPEKDTFTEDNPWGFKMAMPEKLYNRGELYSLSVRRGTLTPEERYKINEHIVQTIKMLDALPFPKHLRHVPELAGGHHEKLDGTGYPKRLRKEDMSDVARMMAIADVFEALTAVDRPYKKGKTLSESLKIMGFMVKDSHLDPDIYQLALQSGVFDAYARAFMKDYQIDVRAAE